MSFRKWLSALLIACLLCTMAPVALMEEATAQPVENGASEYDDFDLGGETSVGGVVDFVPEVNSFQLTGDLTVIDEEEPENEDFTSVVNEEDAIDKAQSKEQKYTDPDTKIVYTYDTTGTLRSVDLQDATDKTKVVLAAKYKDDESGEETEIKTIGEGGNLIMNDGGELTEVDMSGVTGATKINNWAFANSTVTTVTLPTSLKTIGDGAFQRCTKLEEITLPDGLTTIGDSAFYSCEGLETANLPESVTDLGSSAFFGCVKLAGTFKLPKKLTWVGWGTFQNCAELTVEFQNGSWIEEIDGYAFCGVKEVKGFNAESLPELRWIGAYAFAGALDDQWQYNPDSTGPIADAAIVIPGNVYSVGEYAFANCPNLTEITVPKRDNNAGMSGTFSDHAFTSKKAWKTLTIALDEDVDFSMTDMFGDKADCVDEKYPEVVLTDSTGIPSGFFSDDTEQTALTIPATVTEIGYGALKKLVSLETLTLECGEDAAYSYYDLLGGYEGDIEPEIIFKDAKKIPDWFFSGSDIESFTIPATVTEIGRYAFEGCNNLTSIEIPATVTTIGEGAFRSCLGLTSVTVPATVTTMGSDVFADCKNLTEATYNAEVREVPGVDSFDGNLLVWSTFRNCVSLAKVTISDSVKYIGSDAFYGCKALTEMPTMNGATDIWEGAFENTGITEVTIPASVKYIDDDVFAGCNITKATFTTTEDSDYSLLAIFGVDEDKLPEVTLAEGSTAVPAFFFDALKKVEKVDLPSTVTKIGHCAYKDCTGLTEIVIPSGVKEIGHDAFAGCSKVTSVSIPATVEQIDSNAFEGTEKLASVTVPGGFGCSYFYWRNGEWNYEDSGAGRFESVFDTDKVDEKTTVTIAEGTKEIFPSFFGGMDKLTNVTLPNGLITICEEAFAGCRGLTAIALPDSVSSIYERAFDGCANLEEVTLPASLTITTWDEGDGKNKVDNSGLFTNIFEGCEKLKKVVFPANCGITKLNDYALAFLPALEEVVLPNGLKEIRKNAFQNDPKLGKVDVPAGVEKIEALAFSGCSASITINGKKTEIAGGAIPTTCTITCERGSAAEAYAKANGFVEGQNLILTGELPLVVHAKSKLNKYTVEEGKTYPFELEDLAGLTVTKVKSSKPKVARINEDGSVTAMGVGKANITFTLSNRKRRTVTLTVINPLRASKIAFTVKGIQKMSLAENKVLVLDYTMEPATAARNVTWTSSKPEVATVKDGVVTAKALGSTRITVTAVKGTKKNVKATITVKVNP